MLQAAAQYNRSKYHSTPYALMVLFNIKFCLDLDNIPIFWKPKSCRYTIAKLERDSSYTSQEGLFLTYPCFSLLQCKTVPKIVAPRNDLSLRSSFSGDILGCSRRREVRTSHTADRNHSSHRMTVESKPIMDNRFWHAACKACLHLFLI